MQMKMKALPLALLLASLAGSALAVEIPAGGIYDKRVKYINYNPAQVTKVIGHYGFSTHVQFGANEVIANIAIGDKEAWDVAPVENHLFIKPLGEMAETNMTVITNVRVYNFELTAHESKNGAHPIPNDMFFQVNFRYPDEELAKAKAEAEAARLKARMSQNDAPKATNWNYWAKGSQDVSPISAFDDGRFTYLKYPGNREMPAIYIVNPDGSESLVNTTVDSKHPDTIIVQKIARQFTLRIGNRVACIFNENYDPDGIANKTGTTAPGVERVIKGGQ